MINSIFRSRILKQKQLQLEKQTEIELEKQRLREIELQKQREIELEKERLREIELQKQREIELQKQRLREIELEKERLREIELQKQREIEIEIQKQKEMEIEFQKQKEFESKNINQKSLFPDSFLNNIGDINLTKYLNIHTIFSNEITKKIFNTLNSEIKNRSFNNNIFKIIYKTFEAKNNILYENFNEKNINEKGKLVISNHLSLADTFLILNKINNNTFTIGGKWAFDMMFTIINAKDTILEVAILDIFKVILYDRDEKQKNDIKQQMITKIKAGNNILIYPEGDYSETSKYIQPFHHGSFKLAFDNKIPIMPIVLYYNNNNHLFKNNNNQTLLEKILDFFVNQKYSGDIIVHHCNGGNNMLPNIDESIDEFKQRVHTTMQTKVTELHQKYNKK